MVGKKSIPMAIAALDCTSALLVTGSALSPAMTAVTSGNAQTLMVPNAKTGVAQTPVNQSLYLQGRVNHGLGADVGKKLMEFHLACECAQACAQKASKQIASGIKDAKASEDCKTAAREEERNGQQHLNAAQIKAQHIERTARKAESGTIGDAEQMAQRKSNEGSQMWQAVNGAGQLAISQHKKTTSSVLDNCDKRAATAIAEHDKYKNTAVDQTESIQSHTLDAKQKQQEIAKTLREYQSSKLAEEKMMFDLPSEATKNLSLTQALVPSVSDPTVDERNAVRPAFQSVL